MLAFAAFITPLLTAALACASALPRQTQVWKSPFSGTITAPTSDAVLISGANFSFAYARSNWCESDFSPFTVYVAQGAAPPAFESVTPDGALAEGAYTAQLGKYTVSNFGLPLPSGSTAPPANLTLPAGLVEPGDDTQVYITVLQEFDGCPGHIAVEYSLTSVPVTVAIAV